MNYWTITSEAVYWRHYRVRGCDPASFVALSETWGKDSKRVYCQYSAMKGADAPTFEVLNLLWARDHTTVFYTYGRIPEANATSFQALDSGVIPLEPGLDDLAGGFAADNQRVYFYMMTVGKPSTLHKADPASLEVLAPRFGRDARSAYFERFRIAGADPKRFRHLRGIYSTDGKRVFYGNKEVVGAEAGSFSVSESDFRFASDHVNQFLRGELQPPSALSQVHDA